eukprot:TRINITY_DN6497_c0_g2_i1.p1 TRINITY_DN6497_c0_g2~~TRINITY_DN6497_c0_g2_i1.p1  ORF type:complete len:844 (-),score=131.10 TRINITY_DN6497_c0_g2_i1:358-2817(-)
MALPVAPTDEVDRAPLSAVESAARAASAKFDFERLLAEQLCGVYDTISRKHANISRANEEAYLQAAHRSECDRQALETALERLRLRLKSVATVPPSRTPSTATDGDEQLRHNLTDAPAWKVPGADVLPGVVPPLPGTDPTDLMNGESIVSLQGQIRAPDAEPQVLEVQGDDAEVVCVEEDPIVPASAKQPDQHLEVQSVSMDGSNHKAPAFSEGADDAVHRLLSEDDAAPCRKDAGSDNLRTLLAARRAQEQGYDNMVVSVAPPAPRTTGALCCSEAPDLCHGKLLEELLTEVRSLSKQHGSRAASKRLNKTKTVKFEGLPFDLKNESLGRSDSKNDGTETQETGKRSSWLVGDDEPGSPTNTLLRSRTMKTLGETENEVNKGLVNWIRFTVRQAAFDNWFIQGFQRPLPERSGCLADFVGSRGFELVCSFVITMNAVFIAVSSNYAMENLREPSTLTTDLAELTFCVFYTMELILRLIVHKHYYIYSSEWGWNSFDFLLVMVSLQEMLMQLLPIDSTGVNLSFLRILRVMKMVRLFRVVRLMRMFRELRMIWNSIFGCVRATFWAMVLILAVAFMVGVCFVQAATGYLRENQDSVSAEEVEDLIGNWGSVQRATLTLYQSVTSGKEWGAVASTLWPVGMAYYMLFLLFILFYNCVICNTITSLFVEATMVNADRDQQASIQNTLENTEEYIDKLSGWFSSVDSDGNGHVTYDEFCEKLQDPEAIAFASTLEIELTDLKQFFAGLSDNGNRPVNLETFVVGCIRMRGHAKSTDLLELIYHEREVAEESRRQLREFEDGCMAEFRRLRRSLDQYIAEDDE